MRLRLLRSSGRRDRGNSWPPRERAGSDAVPRLGSWEDIHCHCCIGESQNFPFHLLGLSLAAAVGRSSVSEVG